jgi:beta-glucosidase
MNQTKKYAYLSWMVLLVSCFFLPPAQADGKKENAQAVVSELNPKFFYFIAGKIIGSRGFTTGDPKKWGAPVDGLKGGSASGKVSISPEDYQDKGDAVNLSFSRKKMKGDFGLYGPLTNLSAVKNAAALTFDVKVNKKADKGVTVGMDCEYPCRAELEVGRQLRDLKIGQWSSFPIPLNCFQSDHFDLSKINGVFLLATEGKLDISIANIRIERLPAGEQGCIGVKE